ncbi:hypothetical protein JB92DRAFT_3145397 [Gautieria morchelliformis]|nr:hypothetical protein JB92DRAFT_3145397 [Gautieria morchelliformis]
MSPVFLIWSSVFSSQTRLLLSHILSMSFPAYCSPSYSGSSCTPFLNKSVGDQLVYLQCLSFISLGLDVLNHRLVRRPPLTLNVAFGSLLAFRLLIANLPVRVPSSTLILVSLLMASLQVSIYSGPGFIRMITDSSAIVRSSRRPLSIIPDSVRHLFVDDFVISRSLLMTSTTP